MPARSSVLNSDAGMHVGRVLMPACSPWLTVMPACTRSSTDAGMHEEQY